MRAAVYRRYGPPEVVRIEQVRTPVPKADEVLVRVHATTVCAADWRLRQADPSFIRLLNGLRRPSKTLILGMELSGVVEKVGTRVTRFAPGDQVFGLSGMKFGAHAEYACVPQDALAIKPSNMSLEEAAAVLFGAVSALHFLRKAGARAGQKVLIYGASGSVGVFAVQLARRFGAHVTGVCSTANLELVSSLGADAVVDYTREDFSKAGRVYDIVFDTVGKSRFGRAMRSLKHGGVYATAALPSPRVMLGATWAGLTGAARLVWGGASPQPGDVGLLRELIEAGALRTVIDRRYPLADIAEAHRHAQAGHKRGHVVVMIG